MQQGSFILARAESTAQLLYAAEGAKSLLQPCGSASVALAQRPGHLGYLPSVRAQSGKAPLIHVKPEQLYEASAGINAGASLLEEQAIKSAIASASAPGSVLLAAVCTGCGVLNLNSSWLV